MIASARTIGTGLCLAVLLGGCAGSAMAPVEERPGPGSSGGGSTISAAPAQREAWSTPRAVPPPGDTVLVIPLEPERPDDPVTPPQPLPSATPQPVVPPTPSAEPNPAVVALVNRANRDAAAGEHATAAASLERAIKIEPGNAWLWHRLAATRLTQGQAEQAAAVAARSNALAGEDSELRARNWRLIARAHRMRGDEAAARDAQRKANDLAGSRG